ncbi:MAG: tripartite tricarboxylate transporter substrate binding protein [Burkholderiales bacterium]|nr:tripartite tricarboxylate transporter substrate binding protein [Burkholderiales bacterium]
MKFLRAICGAWLFAVVPPAIAQQFPAKSVELVVPFGAGAAPDTVARELARGRSRRLGAQVIVVNKPGAGGAIGYKYVEAKKPDGYTIVLSSNSVSTAYYGGMMSFNYTAFDPVARVTLEMPVLAVQAGSPYRNLKDLVAYVRKHPGEMRVGSTSIGSHMHLTLVGFFDGNNLKVTAVPFPTGGHVASLLGGEIAAVVTLPASLSSQVKAGSLRVLGVLASAREPIFPDVPTATEQGFAFQSDLWRGIHLPKGTPQNVVARLEEAVAQAVESPDFRKLGENVGFLPAYLNSAEFGKMVVKDDAVIADRMARAGIRKNQ